MLTGISYVISKAVISCGIRTTLSAAGGFVIDKIIEFRRRRRRKKRKK